MPKVTDGELLNILATHPDPAFTSTELADMLPISQQAVYKRLERFEREGLVDRKKVAAHATVWWLTEEGKRRLHEIQRGGG